MMWNNGEAEEPTQNVVETSEDQPVAVFFTSDPQDDSSICGQLLNGFNMRIGGRPRDKETFPMLDMILKHLLSPDSKAKPGPHLCEVTRGNSSMQGKHRLAVAEYEREVQAFMRNKIAHPHNLFRDFEEDPVCNILIHSSHLAVAFQVQSMAELEQALEDWKDGTLSAKMAEAFLHSPVYSIFLLGGWNPDGETQSVVMVVCQLAMQERTLLDQYMEHVPTMKLIHLGAENNINDCEAFFDDMAFLEGLDRQDSERPQIRRIRFWQSGLKSKWKGAVLAMQVFYGEEDELTGGMRGSREKAQFFIDIVFEKGEQIRGIEGYAVEGGAYGFIRFETSSGIVHDAGLRTAGKYFKISIPGCDGFELTAFVGESGPSGAIKTLKMIICHKDHFKTKSLDSMPESPSTPPQSQGARRRVMPDADTSGRVTIGSGGRHSSLSGRADSALGVARVTVAGSKEGGGGRRRPWSSHGRRADGEEGTPMRVRPHSSHGRQREERGGGGGGVSLSTNNLAKHPPDAGEEGIVAGGRRGSLDGEMEEPGSPSRLLRSPTNS